MMIARLAFLLAASLLLSISCTQKTSAPTNQQALNSDEKSGFCVMNGLALWDQPSEGVLKWKETLALGEKLQLLDQTAKAVEPGGSAAREFVKVRTEMGTEGWIRSEYLAQDSILAVTTTDDVVLYTQPKNTAATADTIPSLTILAVSRETAGQTFLKVSFFKGNLKKGVYIRNEGVSIKEPDVQSGILLSMARQSNKDAMKKTYLESAKKDYPDSAFISQIDDALMVLTDPLAGRKVEDFTASFSVNDDNVNVRSKPSENSTKVGVLKKNTPVETTQKTEDAYEIGSRSAPWFKIVQPEGWVWGGYLDTK